MEISESHQLYNHDIDAISLGTSSICSYYSYGQISSDENVEFEDNDFDDSDKDPDYLPESNNVGDQSTNLAECEETPQQNSKKRKISPKEKLTRKRTRQADEWIDNKTKKCLNSGIEHLNRNGKFISGKKIKPPCSLKCRLKCSDKINEEIRVKIFEAYWNLGDHTRQWDFIGKHVKIIPKKQITPTENSERRKYSRKYYLNIETDTEIQVCLTMFLNTLSISDKVVHTVSKKLENSVTILPDNRGRHTTRPNKIPDELKNNVREHINSFPVIESHYNRENTKKQYLESTLTISKMHRLFQEWISMKDVSIKTKNTTLRQYTDIFNEYNYSFHKPKKDLCDICERYRMLSTEEKEAEKDLYNEHIENKTIAREKKNFDKVRSENDKEFCVAVFDLEKVLITPQGDVSSFYNKRKFATYNFTIFDIGKKHGYCFVWHQSEGNRGSNEIATCLYKFIKMIKDQGIKEVVFYSDNCGGQNRNRYVYSMWEYASHTLKLKITHRFLERGHTQNEGDSMHAVIENAKRGKIIYMPDQWVTLIRCAKVKGEPYTVFEMSYNDFLDFKPLVENKILNWKNSDEKTLIKWNNIKEVSVNYEYPYVIQIKYNLSSTDSIQINIIKKRQRGRYDKRIIPIRAYKEQLCIEEAKIQDLLSLCKKGLIPKTYHSFYENLKSKKMT